MKREERAATKCNEPLDLGPEARRAFADRQAKLITLERWPVLHWYNDEEFCRAFNTAVQLADEVERLRLLAFRLAGVRCCSDGCVHGVKLSEACVPCEEAYEAYKNEAAAAGKEE